MAEGLGEVVLGIRVDQAQAEAGLERFRQSAIKAATDATQALNRVGGGGATVTPKIDLSAIDDYARRLAALESSVKAPSIDLSAIQDAIAEALELRRKLEEVDGLKARATAEFIVSGLDSGAVANSLQNIQQALQAVGASQVSVSIDSAEFKEATQQAVGLEQKLQEIEKRKAVITAEFILRGLQEGTISQSIANVRRALEQLNTAQVGISVDSSEFADLGRRIAQEEQRLQRLENEQTKIKVQYLVEGLNDGQVTQSIQNLRQALQGLGNVQASVDVNSDDFVRITREIARVQQDIDRVDGRKAVITADFLIRGLNDGTITQSISNVRKALEGLNSAQVVVDVDSSDFTALGQAIVREEQRLQQLQTRQTVVRVQYLIEGLNNGSVTQSVENIRQALQGLGQVQANLDVDSTDFVRATEDVTRLERRLADIDGRRAQISASFTVRGLDDGSITQSIGNVRSALQSLSNAQVAVRVDSQAFDDLGGKIVREEQRLQRLENQQTEVRVKYLVQGLNDGQVTASLRNIQGLVQTLDNQRATLDITSPNLPNVIRQLQEAKQRADALTAKGLQLEVGSFRQGLQSGQIANNTANLERFLGLLREQQRLVPIGSQAFGQLGGEIEKYQRRLAELSGASGGAAGSVGVLQSAFLGLGAAFGVVSVVDIGRRIAEAGLNAETAAVRLRALTRAYGETGQAQAAAASAARALGISQTEAENGISALYASLRPTGIGLKDIETIFLSFNAAARNSGSTAAEASNAFIQLKQALGKGFLNGDELRSIGEQAPIVAQAIAETLGVSVGKLRDLGAQGKITSDVILQSLERIKGTQLAQLGEQLDTGRQKIKDFQIAAEELGKDISKVLAPIGSEFLALATDFAKALAGINADPAKEKVKGVEAEVKRLQEVIELQKKLNLDTTDAKKQLEELEKQLGNLNLQDANVQVANQAYEQRLKLVKQIREEEDRSSFGSKGNTVALQAAVSGFGGDPTGILGQVFTQFQKQIFGNKDFSTRALEEGAKQVEKVFRKLSSGQSLDGFSQNVKAGADEIKDLEDQILALTRKQVELPIEAKTDREVLDGQIKELEAKVAQGRNKLKLQVELEVVDNQLKDVQSRLAKDPNNASLAQELKQLEVAQLRYRAAIQATTAESGKQDATAQAFSNTLNELSEKLKTAEGELKQKRIFSVDFDEAIAKVEELRQELAEIEGVTAKVTAQIILEGIDKGTVAASIGNFQQALSSLQTTQVSLDVRSEDFVKVTQDIAGLEARIDEIDGRKAIITAEFILRGLEEGTITNSLNNARTELDQLNNAKATIDVDSPRLPQLIDRLLEARQRVDAVDGRVIRLELEATQRGLEAGTTSPTLERFQELIQNYQRLAQISPINGADFAFAANQIANFSQITRAASEVASKGIVEAAKAAAETVQGIVRSIQDLRLAQSQAQGLNEGVNRFLSGQALSNRQREQFQNLLPQFVAEREALASRQTDRFAAEGIRNINFSGNTADVNRDIIEFIRSAREERRRDQDIQRAQNELKVAQTQEQLIQSIDNSLNVNAALIERVNELSVAVTDLTAKNWQVNVFVPGGTARGDVVGSVTSLL